jgi:hypothetical protein
VKYEKYRCDAEDAMGCTQRKLPLDEWPEAAQVVNEAGSNLWLRFGEELLRARDISQEIERLGKGKYARGSILPSDYCYNLINKAPFSFRYPVFEWVERGKYTYLGPNYNYVGPILWKGRQVGEWKSGVCDVWEDPRNY